MINPVTTRGHEAIDTFTRPADTTQYGTNDVIAATTSNTGTTALRGLKLGWGQNDAFWLTYLRVDTNLDTFAGTLRVHLYKVSAPTTAVSGDNAAFASAYANKSAGDYIGYVDLPAFADVGDHMSAFRDDLRLPIVQTEEDTYVYYRLEIISGTPTPSSGQSFTVTARSTEN